MAFDYKKEYKELNQLNSLFFMEARAQLLPEILTYLRRKGMKSSIIL